MHRRVSLSPSKSAMPSAATSRQTSDGADTEENLTIPSRSVNPWKSKIAFLVCYVCYASIYFTRKPFSVIKSQMSNDVGLPTSSLGHIDTSFLAAYAVGQFTLAPLGDVLGVRVMLAACLGLSAMASLVFGYSDSLMTFVLVYGVNGFVQSVGFPLCVTALSPWFSKTERGMVLGVWTTSQQVGGVLSTTFAGYCAVHYGWRLTMIYSSAVVMATTCGWYVMLPEPPVGSTAKEPTNDKKNTTTAGGGSVSIFDALQIRGLLNLGMSYFFIKLARYTMLFWLPFYLSQEHGYGDAEAAYTSTLFDFGGVAGSLACGYLSDNFFQGRRMLVAGPFCVATGMVLMLYPYVVSWGVTINGILLFLIGFFVAGPDSVLGGAATQDACERAGKTHLLTTACGLSNGIGSLGSIAQGPLSSIAVGAFGWAGLFRLLGVLCTLGAVMVVPLMRQEYVEWRGIVLGTRRASSG
eukprot:m.236913 g.236913  ORF g.236913 m.236913 type:complete len:465 (+) comp19359_c0_seq4:661-2055(+)